MSTDEIYEILLRTSREQLMTLMNTAADCEIDEMNKLIIPLINRLIA